MGSRDLFIDEAHTALGIFPVSFPCMLPTPLCGIFSTVCELESPISLLEGNLAKKRGGTATIRGVGVGGSEN